MPLNVEIKARCPELEPLRARLAALKARFVGTDLQEDTYFHVPHGRLKLREGRIENHLIHYLRPDRAEAKPSEVTLLPAEPGSPLKALLGKALGVWQVVRKRREIYFIDDVKFHLDEVDGLGTFVEIEAIAWDGEKDEAALRRQCLAFMEALGIARETLVEGSYSDLLLENGSPS
ncbi:MAG: class IV adenylate cyclase [Bacteroidetes bacterium]|nr:MAG: class IV adenylate cyclase [Bacteroidota bacterium]